MRKVILIGALLCFFSCKKNVETSNTPKDFKNAEMQINKTLNQWHQAAAQADFNSYFNLMTKEAVFIGTDPTEHWQLEAFKTFSKPYFDKGKAWSFTPLERHIYVYNDSKLAYFDEVLNTQMKLCRGSGVLKLENNTTQRQCLNWIIKETDFGYGTTGMDSAAKYFFKKELSELNDREIATLVVMLKNTSLFNPIRRKKLVDTKVNNLMEKITMANKT